MWLSVNLSTHILFALVFGSLVFHRPEAAVLVGLGAAIPDLDREYVFTSGRLFSKHQLHRALLHNLFFGLFALWFNVYVGVGVLLHVGLDLLTSPTDRGVELFFPLGRLVKKYELGLRGGRASSGGVLWYLEDPVGLVSRTADRDLREYSPAPWRRVYGPFRNSMFVDWAIFYSSLLFLLAYHVYFGDLAAWLVAVLGGAFVGLWPLSLGLVVFYATGEAWRRRLQFGGAWGRRAVLVAVAASVLLVLYGFAGLFEPSAPPVGPASAALLLGSALAGCLAAFVHVRLKHGKVTM